MISEYVLEIDKKLEFFLQRNVKIYVNNKLYKSGRVLLFNKSFFCFLVKIHNTKKNKTEYLKIPYPFASEYHAEDGVMYFDYRLKTFSCGHTDIEERLKKLNGKTKSKYWNSILEVYLDA